MLNKIIRFALSNRILVLFSAVLITIIGIFVARDMEVDVFPDQNAPTIVVMTEARGMASEEVERLVTFPVETAINGAADVRRVRSSSTTGFSVVWVEFDWGTDVFRARQIVSEKLATVRAELPDNVGNPTLGPQSSIMGEVMIVALTASSTSQQDLRTLADWTFRPRLLSTGGVAQVAVLGGDVKEYQVLLDMAKMKHYGVTLDEVTAATRSMNQNQSGGTLYEYGNEYIVRTVMSTADLHELEQALVKLVKGQPVMLSHIAQVKIGAKTPRLGTASYRAKPAVLLTITKQPNTSTIALTDKLDTVLADIQKSLPNDVQVHTDTYRQSRFITNSIDNVVRSLYEGSLFVVVILIIFLMNARTTAISLITIPLSVLVTILVLKLFGLTLNTMSLGGIAIAIGSLVDDAIVDVENVYKRLRENRLLSEGKRRSTMTVVFEASKEVRMPILNSTLIIVVSFLPLFLLSGMEGRMLKPLGLTFIIALFASTIVALTITPVLCSYLLGGKKKQKEPREPFVVKHIRNIYSHLLEFALHHKRIVLATSGVALLSAILMLTGFGRSFLPPFNEGSYTINVSTMPGISLDESDKIGRMAEEVLLTVPEIKTVGRKTGRAELDEHALGVNTSEIEAPYELKDRTKEEVTAEIREKLKVIPGANIEIGAPVSHRLDAMLSGSRANIAIKIFGAELNKLHAIGSQIKEQITSVEGIADVNVEQQVERPQLKITPRRTMLARYGITMPEFSELVGTLLEGKVMSQVYDGNRSFDLTLKVRESDRATIDDVKTMMIDAADGQKIPLSEVADVTSSVGPNTINRENVSRKVVVSANVVNGDLRSAVDEIKQRIETKVQMPEGYHVEYGGQFESEQAASRVLTFASILSVAVIFLLLFREFKSIRQSAVILLNLPLALIGGVYSIFFTSGIMSIPALIGFISLFGIATRNGMLLVDRYNTLRRQGSPLHESIVRGSLDRLNPILMTALSSGLALIPLALGSDLPGNEIQSPMAKVILGGLISSTLLNGFIVPIMYGYISKNNELKISNK
ncbi:MAG: efflux RND transporter permease subunit [Bacteroidaceae bacterium]